jgi:hypothetical protein
VGGVDAVGVDPGEVGDPTGVVGTVGIGAVGIGTVGAGAVGAGWP